jgi:hypothetical protein
MYSILLVDDEENILKAFLKADAGKAAKLGNRNLQRF